MKFYPEHKVITVDAKKRIEKICRTIALVVAFASVFTFFIKILFF